MKQPTDPLESRRERFAPDAPHELGAVPARGGGEIPTPIARRALEIRPDSVRGPDGRSPEVRVPRPRPRVPPLNPGAAGVAGDLGLSPAAPAAAPRHSRASGSFPVSDGTLQERDRKDLTTISFFDLGVLLGRFADWRECRDALGDRFVGRPCRAEANYKHSF